MVHNDFPGVHGGIIRELRVRLWVFFHALSLLITPGVVTQGPINARALTSLQERRQGQRRGKLLA